MTFVSFKSSDNSKVYTNEFQTHNWFYPGCLKRRCAIVKCVSETQFLVNSLVRSTDNKTIWSDSGSLSLANNHCSGGRITRLVSRSLYISRRFSPAVPRMPQPFTGTWVVETSVGAKSRLWQPMNNVDSTSLFAIQTDDRQLLKVSENEKLLWDWLGPKASISTAFSSLGELNAVTTGTEGWYFHSFFKFGWTRNAIWD